MGNRFNFQPIHDKYVLFLPAKSVLSKQFKESSWQHSDTEVCRFLVNRVFLIYSLMLRAWWRSSTYQLYSLLFDITGPSTVELPHSQ